MLRLTADPVRVVVEGDESEIARLSDEISFFSKRSRFSPSFSRKGKFGGRGWDGRTRLLRTGNQFRPGLLPRVKAWAAVHGVELQIVSLIHRSEPVELAPELVHPDFKAFPFQVDAVDALLDHRWGIVWAPAGVGKTAIGIEAARRTSFWPFVFTVRGRALLHQTAAAFRRFLPGVTVGIVGDGHAQTEADVIVTTQQTLSAAFDLGTLDSSKLEPDGSLPEVAVPSDHHPAVREMWLRARAVVWDEAHHCATTTALHLADSMVNAELVIGLTATPWEEDLRDMVIESVTGPIVYHLTVEQAIALGRVVPAEVVVFKLPNRDIVCDDSYQAIYKASVVDDGWYHDLVSSTALQLQASGHKVAVLVNQIKHGKAVHARLPGSRWIHGKADEQERMAAFRAVVDSGDILVSTVLNEGVDIPGLTAVVIADPKQSRILAVQRPTRGSRVADGKDHAVVVLFEHQHGIVQKHTRRTVNTLRNEPAYTVWERRIHDDGTVSKAKRLGTTKRWGSRKIRILNLHGLRSEDPGSRDAESPPGGP